MEWLNYHHLHAFWVVAREGGLAAAGRALAVSHSTLSAQIQALSARLGSPLFTKVGRRLQLTDAGRLAYRYADEIFSLGREMSDTLLDRAPGKPLRLQVGVADGVPKLVVQRLLAPALALPEPVRLVCTEDSHDRLLAQLALHELDVVISDAPVAPGSAVRAFTHALGETPMTLFAAPDLAAALTPGFPESLEGAPLLLPLENVAHRRALELWLERRGLAPRRVAEFEDTALLKVFGANGLGAFAAPTIIEREVARQYGVRVVGRIDEVRERYHAITVERRVRHPGVVAVTEGARAILETKAAPRRGARAPRGARSPRAR